MTKSEDVGVEGCNQLLQQVFGHPDFRGKQKEIVEAALAGRDVFVLAPTGMGKSLCFQLPAIMVKNGVTLVISPLCSLMTNQVEHLQKKGVQVVAWNSETDPEDRRVVEKDLMSDCPQIRLLYISPEKYVTSECTRLLDAMYKKSVLIRLVIDEAHCISEWGHSFRSDYRRLGKFRDRYGDIPIMALTATATPTVQSDIIHSLKMDQVNLFHAIHPFNRKNLFYEVRYVSTLEQHTRMQEIFEYITLLYQRRKKASLGIIYCRAKATCDALSSFLRGKGLNAKPYHRGVSSGILKATLKSWSIGGHGEPGGVDLVVATVAFGLGIDKGDVRYIIHYDLPTSFEGYYQETGRAGRDGLPSKCILYYSREDAAHIRELVSKSKPNRVQDDFDGPTPTQRATTSIDELIQYAENVITCRHINICRYFGEDINADLPNIIKQYCDAMCDTCKYPAKTRIRFKLLTPQAQIQSFRQGAQKTSTGGQDSPIPNDQASRPKHREVLPEHGKRENPDTSFAGPVRNRKKARTVAPRVLTTLPFGSAATLTKPFKPPLIMPPGLHSRLHESVSHQTVTEPVREVCMETEPEELAIMDPELDTNVTSAVNPSTQLPEVDVELENPSSEKIPPVERMVAFNKIRSALHSLNFNSSVDLAQLGELSSKDRDKLFCASSRDAEFIAMSLSSTADGYDIHIERITDAIPRLTQAPGESSHDEDLEGDLEELKDMVMQNWSRLQRKALR